ncbi:MAG: hypothetical protein LBU22_05280 [Dysgonamonadaceae bacterium]|jgi:glycosyltransferase involved in cell wall biosynthesis|nr:hypothetical protein [Dysgonamonadaceae bacterium]
MKPRSTGNCGSSPPWVEHQPRGVLQAIALGKPVIATEACGLPDDLPWTPVTAGKAEELKVELQKLAGCLKN